MSYDDILMDVMRPGRYIGQEWNMVKKDLSKVKFSVCLCFPEVYDVGMSNLGIRILYDIINSKKDLVCERAFCPWPDFDKALRKNSLKLTSLESKIVLGDFDLLGFSLNNELNYTNILSMLSLSGIPFMSKNRKDSFPLIIGGGSNTLNPEPIADFYYKEEGTQSIPTLVPNFRKNNQYYKKNFECNQFVLVEHAAVRQKWLDQAQSVNLYISRPDSLRELTDLHLYGFRIGLKTFYYLIIINIGS